MAEPSETSQTAEASQLEALKEALGAIDMTLYAVLDGAQFDDLPALLFDHDFAHKPLYLDMGSEDRTIAQTAPQFVRFDKWDYWENELTPMQRAEALLEILELVPSVIFWACAAPPKALFRHLRTINNIMIPREADTPPMPDPLDPEGDTQGNTKTHQQVLFRHADANVIAQVVPELGVKRLPRFFGPATKIICAPDAEWGMGKDVLTFENTGGEWNAKQPLTLSESTMERIEERRLKGLRMKIMYAIQKNYPAHSKSLSKEALYNFVVRCETCAEELGVTEDNGYESFTELTVLTNGGALSDKSLHERIKTHHNVDMYVVSLLDDAKNAKTNSVEGGA